MAIVRNLTPATLDFSSQWSEFAAARVALFTLFTPRRRALFTPRVPRVIACATSSAG